MHWKKTFQARLTEARSSKGLSQRQLALAVGISPRAAGQYEQGANLPSVETLVALAHVLETRTDWLLGLSDHR